MSYAMTGFDWGARFWGISKPVVWGTRCLHSRSRRFRERRPTRKP